MNYTIAVIEDVQGTIKVEFGRNGGQHMVAIYETETKEYTHAKYNTLYEASKVFENLTNAIISGCFSYEQRKEMLT